MGIAINPSILSADFANLQRELERISTADAAHIDVMDNHFVPNLTWGPPVVKRLREISPVPFDVHLMIEDADRWAPKYASMGCESVTFQAGAYPACRGREGRYGAAPRDRCGALPGYAQ